MAWWEQWNISLMRQTTDQSLLHSICTVIQMGWTRSCYISCMKMVSTHSLFRTIYHDNEHEQFLLKLQQRIKLQDKEIEKMCHWQYQGFIDAVRELLQVRGQANSVKVSIWDWMIVEYCYFRQVTYFFELYLKICW